MQPKFNIAPIARQYKVLSPFLEEDMTSDHVYNVMKYIYGLGDITPKLLGQISDRCEVEYLEFIYPLFSPG